MFRSPQWDEGFPGDKMVPALEATLCRSGHRPRPRRQNVHLDIEQRPKKIAARLLRADRGPGQGDARDPADRRRRRLARLLPRGRAHRALRATPRRDLAMEEKRLGDNAVTEGWAMLLQHLTDEPGWLSRKLDFPRPDEYAAEGMHVAALLRAPLLRQAPLRARVPRGGRQLWRCRKRYVELLGDALKIEPSPANYLADIDSGFYVYCLPALVGVRDAAARQPARAVRHRVVRAARGRVAPARALGRGPEADRGRAAQGGHRRRSSRWPRSTIGSGRRSASAIGLPPSCVAA